MRAIVVSICLLVWLLPAAAAEDPLFTDPQILALRITAPLEQLMEERSGEDLPGTVRWQAADGSEVTLEAGIRTRGKFRGDPKNCSFAPLRLNFSKSAVEGTLFDGQDKLKLVTHCRNSARYEQGVVREYLAYRMFNALTPTSFRVRLLDVTYVDSASPSDEQRTFAFLIEDEERFAARAGMERAEVPATTLEALDPAFLNLVSMFEYLIGNTDFSPITGPPGDTCCHNTVLLRDAAGVLYPVPYDFDMSGMVDAQYARPDPRLEDRGREDPGVPRPLPQQRPRARDHRRPHERARRDRAIAAGYARALREVPPGHVAICTEFLFDDRRRGTGAQAHPRVLHQLATSQSPSIFVSRGCM